ncbi:MAG: signal peptide peptidase SppA [Arcobacteraceae bacterium]|nr:signal peptide peptidase SppA [Arcobacteraceae bacterium]
MNFLRIVFLPITAPISFIQNHFKATLLVLLLFFIYNNSDKTSIEQPNLQQINLTGAIMNPTVVLEEIEKAKISDNIKGVLLVVNSPGGAVAPSVEIAYAIKELNKIKPVIAYASGIMASGSYYSSIWATKILANPGSMIGSIGVIMQSVDASELLSKIGVKTQTVKIGTYKEAGTPTRKWTNKETAELNKVIKSTYDMFVQDVANARGLKIEDKENYADAHIFTAIQAKEVFLIDEVTTINNAKLLVVKEAKVKKAVWNKKDKMEKFLDKLISETVSQMGIYTNRLTAF